MTKKSTGFDKHGFSDIDSRLKIIEDASDLHKLSSRERLMSRIAGESSGYNRSVGQHDQSDKSSASRMAQYQG